MISGQNGEFGKNDKFTLLLEMDITAKEMSDITKQSLSTIYRFWDRACKNLNKPHGCLLRFHQFLDQYKRIDRDVLIYRFREMKKGK